MPIEAVQNIRKIENQKDICIKYMPLTFVTYMDLLYKENKR